MLHLKLISAFTYLFEYILILQGYISQKQAFQRLLQPSSVTTFNDSPNDHSWAKPCLATDHVIRRLIRFLLLQSSHLGVRVVGRWWFGFHCPREARHHSSAALDSFSLCDDGWPLILRSPVILRCRSFLSSCSRAWLAPVWSPSFVEPTVKNYFLVIGLSAFIIYAVLLLTQPILCWQT